ncbi:fructose-2,6-bisphosphatase TIGAR isoform X2 [Folsomia candida]|uniref:fructose-2,6-bisphosphatase TIGAR isoform X2 n=1 Tax=Folsomia candida TaxID=158441 RepID=UPI001604B4E4|nr:fructose-2,6-bisphosphatase TIGAR isoform X2 [Folsomia candida]
MLSVTFVRHGETVANVGRIIQGHSHGELTERGISMAEHLGRHLSEEKFTRVFSSDLKRCHDTTRHILKHSSDGDVPEDLIVLDQVLREVCCGDLELQPESELLKISRQTGLYFPFVQIPGGESFQDVKARTGEFFNIVHSKKPGNLVITRRSIYVTLPRLPDSNAPDRYASGKYARTRMLPDRNASDTNASVKYAS